MEKHRQEKQPPLPCCLQNADVYVLDDPLSAVDVHVGRHIFDNFIDGAIKVQGVGQAALVAAWHSSKEECWNLPCSRRCLCRGSVGLYLPAWDLHQSLSSKSGPAPSCCCPGAGQGPAAGDPPAAVPAPCRPRGGAGRRPHRGAGAQGEGGQFGGSGGGERAAVQRVGGSKLRVHDFVTHPPGVSWLCWRGTSRMQCTLPCTGVSKSWRLALYIVRV